MRTAVAILVTFIVGLGVGNWMTATPQTAPAQAAPSTGGFAAVPGAVGSQDFTGPYEVVKGWPKDISTLPGNEKWTYGAGQGVFAESPNRIFMLFRGELPKMDAPRATLLPQVGPSISFPVAGMWRDATQASLPGTGGTDQDTRKWLTSWEGRDDVLGIKGPPYRQLGVDAKWEHCIVVANANGNIIETWTQWDKILRRPHSVYISPYDPEKHVWVIDDNMQVIYKFTNDGKKLVQTIGTPEKEGADATHFNRPTFMDWLPDGTFFVSDGYTGTRVAKFDKDGKFLMDWGIKGNPPNESRPGYMNNVHGVAVDPTDAARLRQRSQQPSRAGVRRERQVPLRLAHRRGSIEPPSALHRCRQEHLDLRSKHPQAAQGRSEGHLLYAWGTSACSPARCGACTG